MEVHDMTTSGWRSFQYCDHTINGRKSVRLFTKSRGRAQSILLLCLSAILLLTVASLDDHTHIIKEARPLSNQGLSYTADSARLSDKIERWLNDSRNRLPVDNLHRCPRAVIVPHAALWCCGRVTASAFSLIREHSDRFKRVFVIGPSHHFLFEKPMLTLYQYYDTPFNSIHVDLETNDQLFKTKLWGYMDEPLDMLEHSVENILPFIGKTISNSLLVPIVTGEMTSIQKEEVGKNLAKYLKSEENLLVISTDFCHWGEVYKFTEGDPLRPGKTVRRLDRQAMEALLSLDPKRFQAFVNSTNSNVCGEVPLNILLHTLSAIRSNHRWQLEILDYKICRPTNQSYVGCAALALYLSPTNSTPKQT